MDRVISKLNTGLLYVAQIALLIMVLVVTFDVLGRWIFNQPITGSVEITELGFSMVIFLSLAYTHLKGEHVSIDFMIDKLPEKGRLIADSIINVVIVVLMGLVAISLFWYAQRLFISNTVTGDLGLPIYIFTIISGVGSVAFALTALLLSINYIKKGG
ncbi:TRAP transporter small permease [Salicibibacter kimchii]|uniref:TRAP transporter small permease n=1 Tax=Salicibibacter kimchii TaxID=2099786 RepID=A0A345C474_9BACI|nr:TRAP transporter small permease [Salicibibacter kimchii]AXF58005.1 TRAP transporter small permease [Salicibibacter kimchii]